MILEGVLAFSIWGVLHIEDMVCIFTLPKTFMGQMALYTSLFSLQKRLCAQLCSFPSTPSMNLQSQESLSQRGLQWKARLMFCQTQFTLNCDQLNEVHTNISRKVPLG